MIFLFFVQTSVVLIGVGQQKRSLHLVISLIKRKTTAFICGDDNSTGDDVGGDYGGEYVDGDVGGGDHGDGDGDYKGDGVTPSVTAIRGSPSPLSHRTACCGSTVMIHARHHIKSREKNKKACVVCFFLICF